MNDIAHWFGQDLSTNATGDLLPVSGTDRGRQRVLRRLLTNPGDYVWHPDYGAGLARYIGATLDVDIIRAVVRAQLRLEAAVAKQPVPTIAVTPIANGVFVQITYTDSSSGETVVLKFDVNQ
jgi:phage baseplate assembly protein W